MQQDDFHVRSFPPLESVGLSASFYHLRVCIVTEEILGPVRNGGIASTYYHLSKGLAAHGHDVHVLFLKGPVVQDETPEYWVKHFAEFGVTLTYLDLPEYPAWGAATEWQRRYAAAYAWLRDEDPFDVVHTSEWRGGLVYALMAKRLGLAFRETLFLVKTSSPHIWNRHYQMSPIERRELVLASYAEQKCVELADAVIGGSAHLISFMDRIGYSLPETNVFVQPNIVDFSNVVATDSRIGGPRLPGDVVRSRDLVFFGRLEGRKGIQLFCNALDILRERGVSPDSVTFLGKWGAPLASHGGMTVPDYIDAKSQDWDCPVTVLTDKNQPEALSYLCSRDMIAVMPSLIENSTMAVYETLEKRIPFLATAVGGTPELIDEVDHDRCLVEPNAQALADGLAQVLVDGQVIARPSFSNDANLGVWYGFHSHVGEMIARLGREQAVAQLTAGIDRPGQAVATVAYAVLIRRGDRLDDLVGALRDEPPHRVVLGVTDAAMRPAVTAAGAALTEHGVAVEVLDCIGQAAGDALNSLAATAQAFDAMVVAHGADVWPRPGFLDAARVALGRRPDSLFTTFFTDQDNLVGMPIGGDVASQFFTSRAYGPELVALRSDSYDRLGRFEPYDVAHGIVHEYVTRAAEAGRDLLVFPEQLLVWSSAQDRVREFAEDAVYSYLKAKPLIDGSSLANRKITLTALNQAERGGGAFDERALRVGEDADLTQWLMPVGWNRQDVDAALKRRLVVALDEVRNEIWLYARGPGQRRLTIRGAGQPLELVESHGEESDENYLTLSHFGVPTTWDAGVSYPALWGLYENDEKLRNLFLRINKLGADTFALAGRNPVLRVVAVRELVNRQLEAARMEAAMERKATFEPVDIRDLPDLDGLVALASATGRAGMERKSSSMRSRLLLEELTQTPVVAPKKANVRSHLTQVQSGEWAEGDWLVGWAWDQSNPDLVLHIAVVLDGEPLFVVAADAIDPSLDRRTPGLGGHAYRIPVLPEFLELGEVRLEIWEGRLPVRDGALEVVDEEAPVLRPIMDEGPIADDADDVDELVAMAVTAAMRSAEAASRTAARGLNGREAACVRSRSLLEQLKGVPVQRNGADPRSHLSVAPNDCGWAEGDWLTGWAWDRSYPDKVLHVAVVRDGEPMFLVAADDEDPSLDRRTPGLGRHAYRIPVLPEFLEPGGVRLEVWEGRVPVRTGALEVAVADETTVLRQAQNGALADLVALSRARSERKARQVYETVRTRSRALLAPLTVGAPVPAQADIRSHLTPLPSGDGWAEGDWLTGWAWDRSDPDKVLHLAVVGAGDGVGVGEGDGEPILVVAADTEDPSLDRRTPGLGRHAYRIPVLPEFLRPGGIRLEVWEGRMPVREGVLELAEEDPPVLRQRSEAT